MERIHESNLIEGIDDPKEDKQSMVAWKWLKRQKKIGHYEILKVQKMITINQTNLFSNERGYYRDLAKVNVTVGGHVPPNYNLVPCLMDNWVLDFQDSVEPMEMHIRFEKIHPFVDGNGRTGRMLLWYHENKLGITPTLIKSEERYEYYELLRSKIW